MSKIHDVIREAYSLGRQLHVLSGQYNEQIFLIKRYFDKKDVKFVDVKPEKDCADSVCLEAVRTERVYTDYNVERLEKKISKNLFKEITDKEYQIVDMDGLASVLKNHGVKFSEFKKFIRTTTKVNRDKIKQAYALGKLTMDEISGCYSANIVKSVQIKEKKDAER